MDVELREHFWSEWTFLYSLEVAKNVDNDHVNVNKSFLNLAQIAIINLWILTVGKNKNIFHSQFCVTTLRLLARN